MYVADNISSLTKGGSGIDYRTVNSFLIRKNLIFGISQMLKNHECPTYLILIFRIRRRTLAWYFY